MEDGEIGVPGLLAQSLIFKVEKDYVTIQLLLVVLRNALDCRNNTDFVA